MPNPDLETFLRATQIQLHTMRIATSASGHLASMTDIDTLMCMAEDDAKKLLYKLEHPAVVAVQFPLSRAD
jgi:predicted ATP-dependent endonuclease of OLD family